MGGKVTEVTDQDFDGVVLNSETPVFVDFWAPWCGPCRMVSPVLAELADENDGKVKVCKLNVDENVQAASRYGITGIPTVMVFKGGKHLADKTMVGVRPKAQYQAAIDEVAG